MKNKAFTLIELMGVIIILGLLSLIAIPAVTKNMRMSKENVYAAQIKRIEDAANDWGLENIDELTNAKQTGTPINLELKDLQENGNLPLCVTNPKTGKAFNSDLAIELKYTGTTEIGKKLVITVIESSIKKTTTNCKE